VEAPEPKRPRRLRRALWASAGVGLWFALHTCAIAAEGLDEQVEPAELGVVLGSKVELNGLPSERLRARLERALELYRAGTIRYVLLSGGFGQEGFEEATVMRAYLQARGVPAERLLEDREGWTTLHTARNAARLMEERGFSSALVVTSYYHVSRTKLAFRRCGVAASSAGTRFSPSLREPWALAREFVGYYVYLVRPL